MFRILLILLAAFSIACQEVSFKKPQPEGKKILKQVPRKLQGKYLPYGDDIDGDTLVITPTGYRIDHRNNDSSSPKEEANLSDSLILKYYKGYYFINFYDKPRWFLRVIQIQKNDDIHMLHFENESEQFKAHLKKLSKEIQVDSAMVDGKMRYQINPEPKELIRLIEKDLFNRTMWRRIR